MKGATLIPDRLPFRLDLIEGIRFTALAHAEEVDRINGICRISTFGVIPLLLATRNAHKTREFAQILGREFVLSDLANSPEIPAVEEIGSSFEENAVLKAVTISKTLPGLVVADDSGLEVNALGGAPGIFSARYSGENATDQENVHKLLHELGSAVDRRARFRCAIALAREDETLAIVAGELEGSISLKPHGKNGFGYDPVFVPTGYNRTLADLGEETKNRISHRARAIAQLRDYFESNR